MNKNILFLLCAIANLQTIHAMEIDFYEEDVESKQEISDSDDNNKPDTEWVIKNKRGKPVFVRIARQEGDKRLFVPTNKELDENGYFYLEQSEKVTMPLDEFGTDKFIVWVYDTHELIKMTNRVLSKKKLLRNPNLFPKYTIESDYADLSVLIDKVKEGLSLDDNDKKEIMGTKKRR